MSRFFILSILLCIVTIVDAKASSGDLLLTGENSVALLTKFAVSANESGFFQLQLKVDTEKGMYTDERQLKITFLRMRIVHGRRRRKLQLVPRSFGSPKTVILWYSPHSKSTENRSGWLTSRQKYQNRRMMCIGISPLMTVY